MLLHAIQGGAKEGALHVEEKKEQDPSLSCSIQPKTGPLMRNIRENMTSQQWLFHAVQGENQRQGPPCGIYERIGPLSKMYSMRSRARTKDRALHAEYRRE
jgi:hypothetical protein